MNLTTEQIEQILEGAPDNGFESNSVIMRGLYEEILTLRKRIAELEQERGELAYQNGLMRKITDCIHPDKANAIKNTPGVTIRNASGAEWLEIINIINQSPQQSLAEHDAEVARKAYVRGYVDASQVYELGCEGASTEDELFREALPHANEYAQRIKESTNDNT